MHRTLLLLGLLLCPAIQFAQVITVDSTNCSWQESAPPPPPPPPPPPEPQICTTTVNAMPFFLDCMDENSTLIQRIQCADSTMMEFIQQHLIYPKQAYKNKHEGVCVVKFIIQKDGQLTDFELVRDIGMECGKAALQVANQLPRFISKTYCGKPVKTLFHIPVRFSIADFKGIIQG